MSPRDDGGQGGASVLGGLIRASRRWSETSMTGLLVVQLVVVFGLVPALAAGLPLPPSLAALLLVVVTSLTVLMARGRWAAPAGLVMLLLTGATTILQRWSHSRPAMAAGQVVGLLAFVLLSVVVLRAVFGPGRVTAHRIRGAVVLYLNLGLLFAFADRLVAGLLPGAYLHLPPPEQTATFAAAFDYLSFTTLTSLGISDIMPVHPVARSLCMLEATMGQLLPTVLIARVVTMAMRQDER